MNKKINDVTALLPIRLKEYFEKISENDRQTISEIRIRADKPIILVSKCNYTFLSKTGKFSHILSESLPKITKSEFSETVNKICGYSIHSLQNDLINGFITLKGGNRVGICGVSVVENERVISIRQITSLNIRIANEVNGSSDEMLEFFKNGVLENSIIAGPPMSGKTTVLRDMVKQISNGKLGEYFKCVVVDERNEIGSIYNGILETDLGVNTDILSGCPKGYGLNLAIRTMSPDIIFCDEIGSTNDVKEIKNGICSGVKFVVTVHASTKDDLNSRPFIKELNDTKMFKYIFLLNKLSENNRIKQVFENGELIYENGRSFCSADCLCFDWQKSKLKSI